VDKVALALRDYEDLINKFESNESVSDSLKGISLRSAQRTYGFYFSNLVQKVPNYRSEKVQKLYLKKGIKSQ